MPKKIIAIFYAVLAAVFYAVNMPFSKTLLQAVPPTLLASLLYFGAGVGIGLIYLASQLKTTPCKQQNLTREDLPYTLGMIVLDIIAPILLMFGLAHTTSANASLLNNFEIVATSLIALLIFKEAISARLWRAILLVTLSSLILSFEDLSSLTFSWGSLLVLLAACCWGLENNCTKKLAAKNTYEIVMLKGLGSGMGSLLISLALGEALPSLKYILLALTLGFVAYGLSIFFYIKAQNVLGAAKTSAYYAIAPFIGAFLSFIFLQEALTLNYLLALLLMLAGSALIAVDTLTTSHTHQHTHTVRYWQNGVQFSKIIEHSHSHSHLLQIDKHLHKHTAI